jgi:hypothetical protein
MAGEAEPRPKSELDKPDRDATREAAAKLYGLGYSRREIARHLYRHIIGNPNGLELTDQQWQSRARQRLRDWERQPAFRDLIWEQGLIKTDLQSGQIMNGLVQKAKRGRVDAAKLALELTGRYTPKGEVQPAQVAIVLGGLRRPIQQNLDSVVELNGPEVEEEADDV